VYSDGKIIFENSYTYPDLYLLDKQLSGSDGLAVCNYLKTNEQTKEIPVVMMSAYPNVEELALNAGADGFIEKPFAVQSFLKAIQMHLQKQMAE